MWPKIISCRLLHILARDRDRDSGPEILCPLGLRKGLVKLSDMSDPSLCFANLAPCGFLIFGFFVFSFHFSSQHYTNNQTKKKKKPNYVLFFFSSLYIRYNNNNNTIASILKSSILSLSLSLSHTKNTEMLLSQLQSSQAWILPPRVPRLGRVSTSNPMR